MSKVTLEPIASGFNLTTVVNGNNDTIEEAFDNTLSRDGSAPNGMEASLDMNSHTIINLGSPVNDQDAARWIDVTDSLNLTGTAVPALSGNSDKFLTNNGSTLSWGVPTADFPQTAQELANSLTPTDRTIPDHDALGYIHTGRYGADNTGVAFSDTILNK